MAVVAVKQQWQQWQITANNNKNKRKQNENRNRMKKITKKKSYNQRDIMQSQQE